MSRLNTEALSNPAYWYLRGLDVDDQDISGVAADARPYTWHWPDLWGNTSSLALVPKRIVYVKGSHYYTTDDPDHRGRVTRSLAPLAERFPAEERRLGGQLSALSSDGKNLYLLDCGSQALLIVNLLRPGGFYEPGTLPLPKSAVADAETRIVAWQVEGHVRALLWNPDRRGFTFLVQEPGAKSLRERGATLVPSAIGTGDVRIGDALVLPSQAHSESPWRTYLYFSELRTGSVFRLLIDAFESGANRAGAGEEALRIVGCDKKELVFGTMGHSQLMAPVSLAVFQFMQDEPMAKMIRNAFGGRLGEVLLKHRFLVCVDSAAARVVTISLDVDHHVLPLIGYGHGPLPMGGGDNLLNRSAYFDTVVPGRGGALLFGRSNQQGWLVLTPQLEGVGSIRRIGQVTHS
jgi:hypothetical protein